MYKIFNICLLYIQKSDLVLRIFSIRRVFYSLFARKTDFDVFFDALTIALVAFVVPEECFAEAFIENAKR